MTDNNKNNPNLADKTRQSFIWFSSVPFLIHSLRFANSILLARLLSPSDFGVMGIIAVIIYYCDTFSNLGFGQAIIQRKEISEHHYASYFSFNLLVSILFFLGAQELSDWLSGFYQMPELASAIQVSSFLFLITSLAAPAKSKLQRDLNYKPLAIIEGLKVGVSMTVSLSLALQGYAFWSMIYAMLLSNIVGVLLLLYVSRFVPRFTINFKPLRDLFHFGLWGFLGAQSQLIIDSADKLIIGKFLGIDSVGFYDKAQGLARMPNDQISIKLSQVSFSTFSRIQDDSVRLERYFFKIELLNATILFPILIGLAWVSESFVLLLLGEKWLPSVSSLQILAVSFIFTSLTNPIVAINNAIGLVRNQTLIRMVLTVILVVGLVQVSQYGIEFSAFTVLVFNVFMFMASFTLLNAHLNFGWIKLFQSLMPIFFLVCCMVLVLFIFQKFSAFNSGGLHLFLEILIGGISYSLFILILPFKSLSFLRKRILQRLKFEL